MGDDRTVRSVTTGLPLREIGAVRAARAVRAGTGEDAVVVERSLREPAAFAELYDRHAAVIFRFAARRLGSSVAEDVTAETFLAAFWHRHRYDLSRGDARPWLYGIASNLIGRQRRDEVRRLRALARLAAATDEAGAAQDIDDRIWAGEMRAELAAALASLPRKHRDTLLLVAWAELSYEETAEALAVPIGTVRSRVNRARHRLREALPELDADLTNQGSNP